jgi:hypothetical protein
MNKSQAVSTNKPAQSRLPGHTPVIARTSDRERPQPAATAGLARRMDMAGRIAGLSPQAPGSGAHGEGSVHRAVLSKMLQRSVGNARLGRVAEPAGRAQQGQKQASEPLAAAGRLRGGRGVPRVQRACANCKKEKESGARVALASAREGIQPKLMLGAQSDPYEQEADRVAASVMRMPEPGPETVQRACSECKREPEQGGREPEIRRQEATSSAPEIGPDTETEIHGMRGSGQPLPPSVRRFMEPRFGEDFSGVRIHKGPEAVRTAQALNARAYTVGRDVMFGAGQYAPDTSDGRKLLAHELTHVAQQEATPGPDQSSAQLVQRDDDGSNAVNLDQEYQAAVQSGDWLAAAEWLNGFNREDIQARLAMLTQNQIASLHKGALDNPRVGSQSQIAQLTEPGTPLASTPPPAASIAPPPPVATTPGGAPAATTSEDQASRARQVACVVRLGGCPSSRDGGIPSSDDIQNYNQQCKEKEGTQYTGPDITPTDDECKNPPQAPPPAANLQQEGWTTGEKVAITVLAVVGTALAVGAVVAIVAASGGTLAPLALAVITAVTPVAEAAGGAALGAEALGGATIVLEVTGGGAAAAAASAPVVATATLGATGTTAAAVAAAPAVAPAVATIAVAQSSSAALATAAALGIGASVTLQSDQPPVKEDDQKKRPCKVGRYGSLICPAGEQAHHIVADYTLRCGNRTEGMAGKKRIEGLPSFRDGPSICLQGYAKLDGDDHHIAHAADAPIEALGLTGSPKGTAPISAISPISIAGATTARPDCAGEIVAGVAQQPSLLGATLARTTIMPPKKYPCT